MPATAVQRPTLSRCFLCQQVVRCGSVIDSRGPLWLLALVAVRVRRPWLLALYGHEMAVRVLPQLLLRLALVAVGYGHETAVRVPPPLLPLFLALVAVVYGRETAVRGLPLQRQRQRRCRPLLLHNSSSALADSVQRGHPHVLRPLVPFRYCRIKSITCLRALVEVR